MGSLTKGRKAMVDALTALIDVGSSYPYGYLSIYGGGQQLCVFQFAVPAFSPADTDGTASPVNMPRSATVITAGTASSFSLFSRSGSLVAAGTVGTTTGDLRLDTLQLVLGATVTLNSFTISMELTDS